MKCDYHLQCHTRSHNNAGNIIFAIVFYTFSKSQDQIVIKVHLMCLFTEVVTKVFEVESLLQDYSSLC